MAHARALTHKAPFSDDSYLFISYAALVFFAGKNIIISIHSNYARCYCTQRPSMTIMVNRFLFYIFFCIFNLQHKSGKNRINKYIRDSIWRRRRISLIRRMLVTKSDRVAGAVVHAHESAQGQLSFWCHYPMSRMLSHWAARNG